MNAAFCVGSFNCIEEDCGLCYRQTINVVTLSFRPFLSDLEQNKEMPTDQNKEEILGAKSKSHEEAGSAESGAFTRRIV